jgi:hypothetical protein
MMSELENARAHLLKCQEFLAECRRDRPHCTCPRAERTVLAALSWLWDVPITDGNVIDINDPRILDETRGGAGRDVASALCAPRENFSRRRLRQ